MEIDFITAFGRLLRDGKLRDAFAANPQAAAELIQLRRTDLPAWLGLIPADVEFQAAVLLRKRFEVVKYLAPETCRQPGDKMWQIFQKYARIHWPPEERAKIIDAFQFCSHLRALTSETVAATEWNRLEFAISKHRVSWHWVEMPMAKGKGRRGFQIFLRGKGQRWREFLFYLRL